MGAAFSTTLVPISILTAVFPVAFSSPLLAEGSRSKANLTEEGFARLLTGRVPAELGGQFHEALGERCRVEREYDIAEFVPLTEALRLRFTASDYGAEKTVEAATDDIEIIACPDEDPAGVEENVDVDTPEQVELLGSRHNPFANSTHVFFALPRRMHVSIGDYDATSRLNKELLRGIKSAGSHSVPWDGRAAGRGLPPGPTP